MMKRLILLVCLFAGYSAIAQIKTPAASPKCTVSQAIGLTDVTIEYSRPSVKGRDIFSADGLVPHGALWRLGANAVTKMTFSDAVKINGKDIDEGTYGVTCTPNATEWTIHFHKHDSNSWGKYIDREPLVSVSSPVNMMPMSVESFTIITGSHTDNSAKMEFLWDKTYVEFDIVTEVDDRVMKNIEAVIAGPSKNDFYQAATYYHKSGKDLGQALSWIEKATDGDDKKFWQVRRKALILADMGKIKEAKMAAETSMKLAEAAGNNDYVKMNKASIAEWSKK